MHIKDASRDVIDGMKRREFGMMEALERRVFCELGQGVVDFAGVLARLRASGYDGWIAYEMCAPLEGGGAEANLDRCARRFLDWLPKVWAGK